jgi:serine/threonine protein kinase
MATSAEKQQTSQVATHDSDVEMGGTGEDNAASASRQDSQDLRAIVGDAHDKPMPDLMPIPGGSHGRIGRYQIIKTLGEGSFGKVKREYISG